MEEKLRTTKKLSHLIIIQTKGLLVKFILNTHTLSDQPFWKNADLDVQICTKYYTKHLAAGLHLDPLSNLQRSPILPS